MTGYKDYGSDVTENPQDLSSGGSYAAEEHSFETVIIQEDKPVIDWEMNLRNQISALGTQVANQSKSPTCWLNGDFLESPNPNFGGSYMFFGGAPGTENKFQLKSSNIIVNGWNLKFEYSGTVTPGFNEIQLGAPPVIGTRTDLVILEVWRALISPDPSTSNKSATSLIVRHGNIKAPDGVNLADDLIDPVEAPAETSKRVQIQYRYRVIQSVNTDGYPDGIDDPSVFANTVSDFSGPGADGSVTGYNYVKHPTDAGLWIAGAGNSVSAAALGTVDGFMYATPICAVFRRNLTAFNRGSNLNGGTTIASGTPSRPDNLFVDQIASVDIRDMRRACAQSLQEVLEKTTQQIFDNSLSTHQETYNGITGTNIFVNDDIGTSGSLGNPDGIRRHFSDRSVTESIVVKVDVGGVPQASAIISLSSLRLAWFTFEPGYNALSNAPAGTNILSITKVRRVDGSTNINALTSIVDKIIYSVVIGPGIDQAELQFSVNQANVSFYVELLVEYPKNNGASRNIRDFYAIQSPPAVNIASWVDSSLLTATSDANRFVLDPSLGYNDLGHREAVIRLQTVDQSFNFFTTDVNELMIWDRMNGDPISINDGINPAYSTTNYTVNDSYTTITLSGGSPILSNTSVNVTYKAFRPAPIISAAPGDSYQFYYNSAAIQAITPPAGQQTLSLIPRLSDQNLFIITASTGSPDDSFPYYGPSEQIAVGKLPSPDFPEAVLDGPAQISTLGFDIDTGFLRLGTVVPYTPNPAQVQLFRDAIDTVQDAEGRGFWPRSQDPTVTPQYYSTVLFGVQLSFPQTHKLAMMTLMELKEDFASIGRKGQLVMVVFSDWAIFSQENKIEFHSALSSASAAVYKINGNMLNARSNNA